MGDNRIVQPPFQLAFGSHRDECVDLGRTVVRPLRCELLSEHLGQDTGHLDARQALQLYRVIAQQNRRKREVSDPDWQGIAFSLDPAAYGE